MTEPLLPLCKHAEPVAGCKGCLVWQRAEVRAAVAVARGVRETPPAPPGAPACPGPPATGPGTEVLLMTAQMGIAACQSCHAYALTMNLWGVAGCREHFEEIVAHLEKQAAALGWFAWVKAGGKAIALGLPTTARDLAEEAISRAFRQEISRENSGNG